MEYINFNANGSYTLNFSKHYYRRRNLLPWSQLHFMLLLSEWLHDNDNKEFSYIIDLETKSEKSR